MYNKILEIWKFFSLYPDEHCKASNKSIQQTPQRKRGLVSFLTCVNTEYRYHFSALSMPMEDTTN